MRRILTTTVAALFLLLPISAEALGMLQVDDVIAGFDTRAVLTNGEPGSALDVHILSPSGDDTVIPVQTDAAGAAEFSLPARLTAEAGRYRVFGARGQTKITEETAFTTLSAGMDPHASRITIASPTVLADGSDAAVITVTLRDRNGNPLVGRPVQLIGSRVHDRISPVNVFRETDEQGQQQFTLQTNAPGTITLRAMDILTGTILQSAAEIVAHGGALAVGGDASVWPGLPRNALLGDVLSGGGAPPGPYGVLDRFEVTVSTPAVKVKDVIPQVIIKAVDAQGRTVESFTGTVHLETPGDPGATLPGLLEDRGKVTFTGKHRGVFQIPWGVSFLTPGTQTIRIADQSGAVTGSAVIAVSGSAVVNDARKIRVQFPSDGDALNIASIDIAGSGPALHNLLVWAGNAATDLGAITAGVPLARGETDGVGKFSIPVMLPDAEDILLVVRDQAGVYDSGPVRVSLDTRAPVLQFEVRPQSPKEGEPVDVTVTSEPRLPSVTIRLRDQEMTLDESGPGAYRVSFPAPPQGESDFTLRAIDPAGNVAEVPGTLTALGPDLPQVQNVVAEPVAGGITLTWDAIPDATLTAYRIQVGRSAARSDFTLDTPGPIESAAVMGLSAGIDYVLTVRAMRGEQWGVPSDPVVSRTLGMELSASPQENALLLQWTFPDATPLSSFILEYGVEVGRYTEKRTLNGSMRAYTLKDLLPTTYHLRLTPVASNGTTLSELAAVTDGTPLVALAFRASTSDEWSTKGAPANALHAGAPATPGSGIPLLPLWAVLGPTGILTGAALHRRNRRIAEAQKFLRQMQRRYTA